MLFSEVYKNKTVIVTGCTGFKGSWLALWLVELGANVIGISLDPPSSPSHFESINLEKLIHDLRIDIRDQDKLKNIFNKYKPDFIFHLAAQSLVSESISNTIETFSINTLGTITVLECLKELQHNCNAVFITSDKCYENVEWLWGYKETDKLGGKDPYSASKAAAEIAISSYSRTFFSNKKNIKIATTRAGNVIGGGDWAKDRIVPDCIRSWISKKKVNLRNPFSTRPWQHVLEPISGYLRLGEYMFRDKILKGESFNFGPTPFNTKSVEDLVIEMSNYWPKASYKLQITKNNFTKEANLLKLNCEKAYEIISWRPLLEFETTIKLTAEWYFNFYNNKNAIEISKANIKYYTSIALEKKASWIID